MKTSDEQTRAFANIAAGRDGELLMAWLEAALKESDQSCRTKDGPDLYRAQGCSTFILAFRKALEESRQRMKLK